jgi:hypothetical protein
MGISSFPCPCFSKTEEESVQLTKAVPLLLEDKLTKQGANHSKGNYWA